MTAPRASRRGLWRLFWATLALLALAGFLALGQWQLERRAWKLDLIDRVEQRVNAEPVTAPAADAEINTDDHEYLRVRVEGEFLHQRETLVQASTRLGSGYWVLTPLRRDDGTTVLVNRGFVAPENRGRERRRQGEPEGPVSVTGLLRLSEPVGAFLRENDPHADRWYSRDVGAMARARGLDANAGYFIDAEADGGTGAGRQPVGGLTVLSFRNNHLVYALTWYTLALMVAAGAFYFARAEMENRNAGSNTDPGPDSGRR